MSFNDLERGLNERAPLARDPLPGEPVVDREFQNLANKVSTHIFRINSNVSGLQKLIDLLGSSRDTSDIQSTREFIKNSSSDAKKLASWQVTDSYNSKRFHGIMQVQFKHFKGYRGYPWKDKNNLLTFQQQQQLQQQQLQKSPQRQQDQEEAIPDYELDYQEALIEERENEIREIEVGINELNQIFRDLGTIVQEQGGNIDNIESNVHRINEDMSGAVTELHQAHEYQKKSGKKMLCLLIIFVVVLSVILIAILA
ncbi:hypothetical protein PSHT_07637 [Puccinia striiformis]|uniref:t-SNARE coiled-coil homology domain-containing protein n=1 Tax=Puccinia striiformis TaxID=27350 RepID=A0A2S4VW09_9BASI|nr:hypothetical protein PSHT_07637 [Puccinia striiformis]